MSDIDDTQTVPIAMRVPPDVKRKFRDAAHREDITMTELFTRWVADLDDDVSVAS